MGPFGRENPSPVEILRGAEWTCNSCEQPHVGMFDIASQAPDPWPHEGNYEPNSGLRLDGDFLSEDFCVLEGTYFMVRCVLEIPVHGLADKFAFGCWGSLKRENFETYVDHFDGGTLPEGMPWWSWLCNRLHPYVDEDSIGCWMHPQLDRQRPVLSVDDPDHPLGAAQHDGISPEQLLDIYAHYGHAIL